MKLSVTTYNGQLSRKMSEDPQHDEGTHEGYNEDKQFERIKNKFEVGMKPEIRYIAGEPAESDRGWESAIIIYFSGDFERTTGEPTSTATITYISLQSTILRETTQKLLKGYPGVEQDLQSMVFKAPFKAFFHMWESLSIYMTRVKSERDKKHLELLMGSKVPKTWEQISKLTESGKMTYDLLWTLFEPGSLVYQNDKGHDRVFRVENFEEKQDPRVGVVQAQYVDWDGSKFALFHESHEIPYYNDEKSITNLILYPIKYHPDIKRLEHECIIRGQRLEKNWGSKFRQFRGVGRVMVNEPDSQKSANMTEIMKNDSAYTQEVTSEQLGALNARQLLLVTPWIRGFDINTCQDRILPIDDMEDIIWKQHPFDDVVLENGIEDILVTVSKVQAIQYQREIYSEKRERVTILLRGPPGVGKTSTAQAFAEEVRVPLYKISLGDYNGPENFENRLNRDFERAKNWNAVVLVRDAELLLEHRSRDDLKNLVLNDRISIFLRALDGFRGVIFLSSNRLRILDATFKSCISFQVFYPSLGNGEKRKVLKTLAGDLLTGNKFETLLEEMNGETIFDGWQMKHIIEMTRLTSSENKVAVIGVSKLLTMLEKKAVEEEKKAAALHFGWE